MLALHACGPQMKTARFQLCRLLPLLIAAWDMTEYAPGAEPDAPPPDPTSADVTDLSLEQLMHVQVTGASKFAQDATEAPASVTVLTQDDIKRYGYRTLAEILDSARDFYTVGDGGYTYAGVRGFSRPGDYNDRLLLLIDGHRTNENIYGSALLGTEEILDVDLIDHVEIIRGPASSLYGTNAFFGVINVVTRKTSDFRDGEASASVGSFNTETARLTFTHHFTDGLEVLISGSLLESSGHRREYFKEYNTPQTNYGVAENIDFDRPRTAFLRLGWGDFTLEGAYLWRDKGLANGGYGVAFDDPRNHQRDMLSYLDLSYAHDFSGWEATARVSYDEYSYRGFFPTDNILPDNSTQLVLNEDDIQGKWLRAEAQVTHKLGETHRFTLGADMQDNIEQNLRNYDADPYFVYGDVHQRSMEYGIFAQDEYRLSRMLTLNAGVRYDWYEQFGSTFNPRAALIFQPRKDTSMKLIFGRAFRAPNANEAYYQANNSDANPGLKPEHIQSFEAVLEQQLFSNVRLTLDPFYNQITDLISQETNPTTGHTFYANADSANTHGISTELEGQFAQGIHARASYTWQETHDGSTGAELTNSPRSIAKLNLLVPFFDDKASLGVELQYVSPVRVAVAQNAQGYFLTNLTLYSHNILDHLEVSASVYNLFDERYGYPAGPGFIEETLPADGRSFRLKATYSF
jgi:outer membrane receptor for ferrienterochelin and colicins